MSTTKTVSPVERRLPHGIGGTDTAPVVVDLLAWYYLLRERAGWIILCAALAAGAAFAYLRVTPSTFKAQCVVQVEQEARVLSSKVEEVNPEDFKTLESLRTVEGALVSRSLLLRVSRVNELVRTSPEFQPKPGQPPLGEAEMANLMNDKVQAKLRRGTRLIDINVFDPEATRAAKLAKSVVDEYIRQNYEQKAESMRLANETLFKQRDELKGKLEKSEMLLQDYREKYGVLSLEMATEGKQTGTSLQSFTAEKLKELNRQLQEARGERIKLEGMLRRAKQAQTLSVDELLAIEPVAKATDVIEAQKILAEKESLFGEVKKRYLELHPKYQQALSQLKDIRDGLEHAARKAAAAVVMAHESALESEGKLQDALAEQEKVGVELSRAAIPFNVLMRDTQADRLLYDQVSQRVREIELSNEIENTNVRVIQTPDVPQAPAKPRPKLILALALVAGVALPVMLIFLLHAFNTTLRSVDEAETRLDLPSLSAVPQARGKAARRPLVLLADPAGREAEAFRCLRTSLTLLAEGDQRGRTVLLTSAVPAEGKSFCSANCAVTYAQQGHRTLLIDADLRRPSQWAVFGLTRETVGVSDVLTGKTDFDAACQTTEIPQLFMMPGGTKGVNPAELLGSKEFRQFLAEAREKFDRIVLDTAPVNAVSDTLLIVDQVDCVVLVVRARRTPARAILRAQHLLELASAPLVGFVLNRLPMRLANYYYYDEGSYTSAGVYGT